ncbi:MAG: hypothetical protein U0790_24440 [Isosphaeraceae bacterium]
MPRSLELPEEIFNALMVAAQAQGVEPAEWIASHLPPQHRRGTEAERKAARELLSAHIFTLGRATGVDNEEIDADLAREYASPHEPS